MVSILLVLGTALILAGYWANAAQADQKQPVRIKVEPEPKRRQRQQ